MTESFNKIFRPGENVGAGSLPQPRHQGDVEVVQHTAEVLPHLLHGGELEGLVQALGARLLPGEDDVDKH